MGLLQKDKTKKFCFRCIATFKEGSPIERMIMTVRAENFQKAEAAAKKFIGDDDNLINIEVSSGKSFGVKS